MMVVNSQSAETGTSWIEVCEIRRRASASGDLKPVRGVAMLHNVARRGFAHIKLRPSHVANRTKSRNLAHKFNLQAPRVDTTIISIQVMYIVSVSAYPAGETV